MSKDGFASLSAQMLIRKNRLPGAATSLEPDRAELRESHRAPITHPDVPKPPAAVPIKQFGDGERRRRATDGAVADRRADQTRSDQTAAQPGPTTVVAGREVPPQDKPFYSGPERRARDVSPVVERRRSVGPRVKVSVRLEQHRYERLKIASEELDRSHQDLMTRALDHYLDTLRIEQVDPKVRHRH